MSWIKLIHHTPIESIEVAAALPYQSKQSSALVKRVWDSKHRSIARHGMASFLVEDISQSLLRQLSRHPYINLTVLSTRYCNMESDTTYIPNNVKRNENTLKEYKKDMEDIMGMYSKWVQYENSENEKDTAKLFLPLASYTDVVISGNYQALYEFLQLRNCTRVEGEFRDLSLSITKVMKGLVPEIFGDLGCRGDELGYCPEKVGSCGKHPQKEVFLNGN